MAEEIDKPEEEIVAGKIYERTTDEHYFVIEKSKEQNLRRVRDFYTLSIDGIEVSKFHSKSLLLSLTQLLDNFGKFIHIQKDVNDLDSQRHNVTSSTHRTRLNRVLGSTNFRVESEMPKLRITYRDREQ